MKKIFLFFAFLFAARGVQAISPTLVPIEVIVVGSGGLTFTVTGGSFTISGVPFSQTVHGNVVVVSLPDVTLGDVPFSQTVHGNVVVVSLPEVTIGNVKLGFTVTGEIRAAGVVDTYTATRFHGGAPGAAVAKVLPAGTNWAIARVIAYTADGICSTCWGCVADSEANAKSGTGAGISPFNPFVDPNLNVGTFGSTLWFGSATPGGGALNWSLEHGSKQ